MNTIYKTTVLILLFIVIGFTYERGLIDKEHRTLNQKYLIALDQLRVVKEHKQRYVTENYYLERKRDSLTKLINKLSIVPIIQHEIHICSGFGYRDTAFHKGIDIAVPVGTPIYSPTDGQLSTGYDERSGIIARVYTDKDIKFKFFHLSDTTNSRYVQKGELIGYSGNTGLSTGPHIHFEILFQGNYIDPESWINITNSLTK